jgi:hypothetical protein
MPRYLCYPSITFFLVVTPKGVWEMFWTPCITSHTADSRQTQLIVPALPRVDTVSYPSVSLPSGSSSGKSKAPLKALSNPSQALAHLQKHQTHLAGLPAEKRAEIEERERWAKAEERAAGGKVADNEKVLKNAVKRMEKAKAKGGKEW